MGGISNEVLSLFIWLRCAITFLTFLSGLTQGFSLADDTTGEFFIFILVHK